MADNLLRTPIPAPKSAHRRRECCPIAFATLSRGDLSRGRSGVHLLSEESLLSTTFSCGDHPFTPFRYSGRDGDRSPVAALQVPCVGGIGRRGSQRQALCARYLSNPGKMLGTGEPE